LGSEGVDLVLVSESVRGSIELPRTHAEQAHVVETVAAFALVRVGNAVFRRSVTAGFVDPFDGYIDPGDLAKGFRLFCVPNVGDGDDSRSRADEQARLDEPLSLFRATGVARVEKGLDDDRSRGKLPRVAIDVACLGTARGELYESMLARVVGEERCDDVVANDPGGGLLCRAVAREKSVPGQGRAFAGEANAGFAGASRPSRTSPVRHRTARGHRCVGASEAGKEPTSARTLRTLEVRAMGDERHGGGFRIGGGTLDGGLPCE
jgi:hypothetical protein